MPLALSTYRVGSKRLPHDPSASASRTSRRKDRCPKCVPPQASRWCRSLSPEPVSVRHLCSASVVVRRLAVGASGGIRVHFLQFLQHLSFRCIEARQGPEKTSHHHMANLISSCCLGFNTLPYSRFVKRMGFVKVEGKNTLRIPQRTKYRLAFREIVRKALISTRQLER